MLRGAKDKKEIEGQLAEARQRIAELENDLAQSATRDSLTPNLLTLRAFNSQLGLDVERAQRYGRPLSLAVIDIDGFGQFNVENGYEAGDALLIEVARTISDQTRVNDIACRIGNDEFGILYPETRARDARLGLDRMVKAISVLESGGWKGMTVSAGLVPLLEGQEPERFLASAQTTLEQARTLGGGKVVESESANELGRHAPQLTREEAGKPGTGAETAAAAGVTAREPSPEEVGAAAEAAASAALEASEQGLNGTEPATDPEDDVSAQRGEDAEGGTAEGSEEAAAGTEVADEADEEPPAGTEAEDEAAVEAEDETAAEAEDEAAVEAEDLAGAEVEQTAEEEAEAIPVEGAESPEWDSDYAEPGVGDWAGAEAGAEAPEPAPADDEEPAAEVVAAADETEPAAAADEGEPAAAADEAEHAAAADEAEPAAVAAEAEHAAAAAGESDVSGEAETEEPMDATGEVQATVTEGAGLVASSLELSTEEVEMARAIAYLDNLGAGADGNQAAQVVNGLDPDAWEGVRGDRTAAAELVSELPGLAAVAATLGALGERWDGTGEPAGMKGTEIPFAARVVSAVTEYHRLTASPPIGAGLGRDEAIREVARGSGSRFDPAVIDKLIKYAFGRLG